jgi:hypothetical protein
MYTKLKRIFIIAILLVSFIVNLAKSQVYSLRSLNGDAVLFKVSSNDEKSILSISYSKDTVYLGDVEYIKIAKVLSDNFLMVVYGIRAGSGLTSIRMILLSASNGKICQSLNITSLFKEEFLDFRRYVTSPMKVEVKRIYKVDISLISQNYKLSAKIHDERKSVHDPKSNYNDDGVANLKFDRNQNIFYSSHEQISQYFTIFDPKTQEEIGQYIKGTLPVVKLGKYKYYYINRAWYEISDNNYLAKYTYK